MIPTRAALQPRPTSLTTWVLGGDVRQRLRVSRALTSMLVYVVCFGLAEFVARVGMGPPVSAVRWMQAGMLVWMLLVYGALRSGWSLCLADPSLTLPQILAASAWVVLSYTLFPSVRGALLMLLALTLVFGIFNLDRRQRRVSNSFAVLAAGAAMGLMAWRDPQRYPPAVELTHFLLVATILPVVSMLGAQLNSIRLRLRERHAALEKALARIRELATRDELTGLNNRRQMLELMEHQITRSERTGESFSVCLIDLDLFKRVNDTWGHAAGDEVLRRFAAVAIDVLRDSDRIARWGGEEFLVLLPATPACQAVVSLQRLREAQKASAPIAGAPGERITFSAGLAEFRVGETIEQTVDRADRALYQAKNEGRDRVVMADGPAAAFSG